MDDFTVFVACVATGIALLFALAFWIGAGAPTLEEEEPRRRITLNPSLAADPFVTDEQCGHCGAFQLRGSVRLQCWNCRAELRSAVVDAGPNHDGAA